MREIVDITPPEPHNLVAELRAELALTGSATAHIDDLAVAVDAWRKAARAAVRALGRPVEIVAAGGSVHAALRDWPANDEETAKDRAGMRAAIDKIAAATIPGLRLV